jgi:ribonuclease III
MGMIRHLLSNYLPDKALQKFLRSAFDIYTRNPELYRQALRHSSAVNELGFAKKSNERLEFLGDAILDSILAHYLFDSYSQKTEGELTKMKSKVVRRENLNRIGEKIGIRDLLEVELGNQEIHESMLGNALEALVGAIYLDKGYHQTRISMLKFLIRHGLTETIHDEIDTKSKLHEWCQKHKKTLLFEVQSHRQDHGNSSYTIVCKVDHQPMGIGNGASKKAAEQLAAKNTCDQLLI